jgi:hypothetical protein
MFAEVNLMLRNGFFDHFDGGFKFAVAIQIHYKYIVSHPIGIVNNYFHTLAIFQAI